MQTMPASVEAFIERMGSSTQADGLPRIAGRLLGFLIIHGGPVNLAELARRLEVSRASVSTNARLLQRLGMIERTTRPGDRRDYYDLAPRPHARLLEGYLERMRRTQADVNSLRADLPDDWPGARRRLAEMQRFYDAALGNITQLIAALDDNP